MAVILAGGSGTRLWPLARRGYPKPFVSLLGGKSLFRHTYERILPVVDSSRVLVVTAVRDVPWVRRQVPEIRPGQILAEEIGRDTAAAVALAAHRLRARYGDAVMVVLPADHVIRTASSFRRAVREAIRAAEQTGGLVTMGVPARSAETGYGYIRPAGRDVLTGVMKVEAFVEKPSAVLAARMAASRRYLWNSGIFVWKASAILDALDRHRPDIAAPLRAWFRRTRRGRRTVPATLLRRVPRSPIDRAVLENSKKVLVLRAPFEWSDVGNWDSLGTVLRGDERGNAGIGHVLTLDAERCLAANSDGLTVFLGVSDVVAVRAKNVMLVCGRKAAQSVRNVVPRLRGALAAFR